MTPADLDRMAAEWTWCRDGLGKPNGVQLPPHWRDVPANIAYCKTFARAVAAKCYRDAARRMIVCASHHDEIGETYEASAIRAAAEELSAQADALAAPGKEA